MHIEPGLVTGAKLLLGYATAAGAAGYTAKLSADSIREKGIISLALRSIVTTGLVFTFFELLPHFRVGVSEVHFILGSTLFLIFGAAPAAIGLTLGLLVQGAFLEPQDIPQFGMNVTTLLVPLFALAPLANRIIRVETPYTELRYAQVLTLSTAYQSGVVLWVAFWALYGGGATLENMAAIGTFAGSYVVVVLIEPVLDVAVLALAKSLRPLRDSLIVTPRLHHGGN
jgi:ABC-type Co2+ transport system permease subunit